MPPTTLNSEEPLYAYGGRYRAAEYKIKTARKTPLSL